MTNRNPYASNDRRGKEKTIKPEYPLEDITSTAHTKENLMATVTITNCINFQKFRYEKEERPGKKYQDKDFLTLRLHNFKDQVVMIYIICTDAENMELLHPNELVGKDCEDGMYIKECAITESVKEIRIPYIRIARLKLKKSETSYIQQHMLARAERLPSPYKERCRSQCTDVNTISRKFDTTKVRLAVLVAVTNHTNQSRNAFHAISHVVRNGSEKTSLNILKVSLLHDIVPAKSGAAVDIFTTEAGPDIEPEKYEVYVSCDIPGYGPWESERVRPRKEDILYHRIIQYKIPPLTSTTKLDYAIEASLHVSCLQSELTTKHPFHYVPEEALKVVDMETFNGRKRELMEDDDDQPTKRMKTDADGNREELDTHPKNPSEALSNAQALQQVISNTYYIDQNGEIQLLHGANVGIGNSSSPNSTGASIYIIDGKEIPNYTIIDAAPSEQIVTQVISETEPRWAEQPASSRNSPVEQSYHVSVAEKRMMVSQAVAPQSIASIADSGRTAGQSMVTDSGPKDHKPISATISHSGSGVTMSSSPPSSSASSQYKTEFTSSPSTIPPIRRMLASNKSMSCVSAWEVNENNEADQDLRLIMGDFTKSSSNRKGQYLYLETAETTKIYRSDAKENEPATPIVSVYAGRAHPIAEKGGESLKTTETQSLAVSANSVSTSGAQHSSLQAPGGLPSTTDTMALAYHLSSLPTDDIMAVAERVHTKISTVK